MVLNDVGFVTENPSSFSRYLLFSKCGTISAHSCVTLKLAGSVKQEEAAAAPSDLSWVMYKYWELICGKQKGKERCFLSPLFCQTEGSTSVVLVVVGLCWEWDFCSL